MIRNRIAFACLALVVACSSQPSQDSTGARRVRATALVETSAGPAVRAGLVTVPAVVRSSNPREFTQVGGFALFSAANGASGTELWRTDGTEAGTAMVADIKRGTQDSWPTGFTVLGNVAYFAADDGVHGTELWRTDGTAAGTAIVADIYPGPTGSSPASITAHDDVLFFTASDPLHGAELWRSDGTADGTWMVADLAPGPADSSPRCLASTPQGLFFGAAGADGTTWRSDGTPSGTVAVDASGLGWGEACFHALGDAVYFLGGPSPSLMKVEPGAPAVTVGAAIAGHDLVEAGGLLYWAGDPGGGAAKGSLELMSFDGISEMPLTSGGVDPRSLRSDGRRVLFTGSAPESGVEVWVADGASARMLADLCAGSCSGMVEGYIAAAGGKFFFTSGTIGGAYTLQTTDGIAPPVALGPLPFSLSSGAFAGALLFANEDASGVEPWVTDGTVAGTHRIANVGRDTSMPGLSQLTAVGNGIAFVASDGSVWFSDGASARRVGAFTTAMIVGAVGDTLVIAAYSGGAGYIPYISVAGAPAVRWTAVATVPYQKGATRDGVLYFAGSDAANGTELWRTDGTASGTWRVSDIYPGSGSSNPRGFMTSGTRIYFAATDPTYGNEPWVTDGTAAGTHRVKDIFVGGNSAMNAVAPDGRGGLLFSASRWAYDVGLWHTDGTDAGTQRISDIKPWTYGEPGAAVRVGDVVLMRAEDAAGTGVWRSDGTPDGTWLVARGDRPAFTTFQDAFYLTLGDATVGSELWQTDGSPGSPELVLDILPGLASGIPSGTLQGIDDAGVILLAADDGLAGTELWISDGTAAGTRLVQDLVPGPFPSTPGEFTRAGDRIFFRAQDPELGIQPWSLRLASIDRRPPAIACPADAISEATTANGAAVAFPPAAATDAVTAVPAVAYSVASGSTSRPGPSMVTATATDEAGNSASCAFHVAVRDTTPPALACPADVVAEATGPGGAAVAFQPAVASDAVTAAPTIAYSAESGSVFPLGDSVVTATATDEATNSTSCTFRISVRDTTAPALACAADVVAEATGPSGAIVAYPAAVATDAVTASPAIAYSVASGSLFPLGDSPVVATAIDGGGNGASCAFRVTVRDTTAPVIVCPPSISVRAPKKEGAYVTYPPPTATDAVTPDPVVTSSPPSRSLFPVGTTIVTGTAVDDARNASTCHFEITVTRH